MRFNPKHAIIGTVLFLFIVPIAGFAQTHDPKVLVWFVVLPLMGWTVWRMRGSQMRKHGGGQLLLAAGVLALGLAMLLLTACTGTGNDAISRRRAERFGAPTPTAQAATAIPTALPTPAPAQQAAGDVAAAVDLPAVSIERDGNPVTQFVIVGLALLLGIPAFWVVSLSRKGARS